MTTKTNRKLGGHPTAERAAEIKRSVVAATIRAFAEKGSDFSMDEVAVLAGVSKQAIYRRWRSKIDLVIDAIDTALSNGFDLPLPGNDDPVAAFEEMAWRRFGNDHVVSNRLSIFLQVESFRDERLRDRILGWRFRFIEAYKQALCEVDAVGRRAPGDEELQAELLMELLNGGSQKLVLTNALSPVDQRRCFEQRWAAFKRIAIR